MYMINKRILTHISKGLVLVKLKLFQIYNNDKSSTNTGVGCHNRMCIKLKTIQVDKSYISNAQLTIQVHYFVSLHDCCPKKKPHST